MRSRWLPCWVHSCPLSIPFHRPRPGIFGYLWVWQGEPLVTEVIRHYRGVMDPGFLDRVRPYGVCSAIADAYYGVTAGIDKNRQIGVAALERSFFRNS
jgi:hypothetical protein